MPKRRRYDDDYFYNYYPPSTPIRTDEGLKARSQRGKIGQSWWAERWIAALERIVDPNRLRRGRSYARSGQVLSLEEKREAVHARVQGSRPSPYRVTIEVKPLSEAQWSAVIDEMAEQAIFAAQLLAGEMPQDIEEAFGAAGASLFPEKPGDLLTACSCPDMANPCKHIAATHYILAEQFDEDPFLLFRMRGRTQEQVLEALRARRATVEVAESGEEYESETPSQAEAEPLEAVVDRFWQPGESLEGLAAPVKPPAITVPLLKRLGPPAFLPEQDLAELLAPAYDVITRTALEGERMKDEG